MTISAIITWLIIGLVIGALGHLLVPGRQRIGILLTLLFGVVGALVGGFVTAAILGAGHLIITFIVSVVVAAVLIAVVTHPSGRRYVYGRRAAGTAVARRGSPAIAPRRAAGYPVPPRRCQPRGFSGRLVAKGQREQEGPHGQQAHRDRDPGYRRGGHRRHPGQAARSATS